MSSTLRDIAKAAKVSAATVSLVLNGRGGISEETRDRVLATAAELNYAIREPKSNRSSHSRTLRFLKIAKHGHTVNRDHNTFISDYIDGMSHEALRRGFKLEVISYEGLFIEEIVESLSKSSIGGVVVLGTELSSEDIQLFQRASVPVVFIDTHFDMHDSNFVNMNNRDAVHKIISAFAQNGFRRIGIIASDVKTINFQLRIEAFQACMKLAHLPVKREDIIIVDSTFDGAYQDMAQRLRNGVDLPECFFCTNDIIAYGCIKAFREYGIDMPKDLSIIGFDNLPMSATMEPPLTTIDVSKKHIGYLAIGVLDDMIRSVEPLPPLKMLVGTNLVFRSSLGECRKNPLTIKGSKTLSIP